MDLFKSGKLLRNLRHAKGFTQKQLADKLGIMPKTISKWETGHGFPDISTLSVLADTLGVSERTLLSGNMNFNTTENGNIKNTKFYVCPTCGSIMQGMGKVQIICCGKPLEPLVARQVDHNHSILIAEVENDFFIEFNHEMTKEHFISFVAYVGVDRVLAVRLYPEQASAVRFPKMYGGKFYFFCNKHGLFEYK